MEERIEKLEHQVRKIQEEMEEIKTLLFNLCRGW